MYPSSQSARHPAQALSMSSQYIPPPYDFYHHHHHVPGAGDPSPTSAWSSIYAPREEYAYSYPGSSPSAGQVSSFTPVELSGTPTTAGGGGSFSPYNFISGQDPFSCRGRPQEAPRPPAPGGKTRTKDKYRVVYTDQQRLELEKEFQSNRYITMKRKTELSMALSLSERQVKIWFQNRRAKERKMNRKKQQHSQQASTTTPTPPALCGPADMHIATSPSSNILSDAISEEY